MKPLQIGLLVAAGALGGAGLMKWQSTRHTSEAGIAASAPAAPAAVTPAEPPAPEPPAAAAPAEPAVEKPSAARRKPAASSRTERAVMAQAGPPAREVRPAPAPPVPAPEQPAPPVRTAPPAIQEPVREAAPPATPAPPAPAPQPEPNRVTLTSGMMIPVRLVDGLSSDRSLAGDTFNATLDAPLIVDHLAIAERGARIEGKIVESTKAGKVSGLSTLAIVLTQITTSDGQRVRIQTQTFTKNGQASHRQDAAKVGAGAGIGAIIGAIAGGGKGAAVGAGVGGAAGAGDVLLTRGKPAELPSETRINFRLSAPVTIIERQ